jgi:hypothetical protein
MIHMQHAQLAQILMERSEPTIEFPSEDRERQRQLERLRDSLLRHRESATTERQAA